MLFINAYQHGLRAILIPYAGYLHLVPSLIAVCGVCGFDPAWVPAWCNGATFALWLVVAGGIFSARIRLPAKPALALALVMVPTAGHVIVFLYNLNWLLALGLVLVLIADDADTLGRRVVDRLVVLLCGLTGPFAVFLWPLFIIRAAVRRSVESGFIAAEASLVAALQALLMYHDRAEFARSSPPEPGWLVSVLGGRLFGTFFAGYRIPQIQPDAAWIVLALGATALGIFLALKAKSFSAAQRTLAGAWLCLVVPVALKFLREVPPVSMPANGDRYFFLPHVLLAWLLVILAAEGSGWKRWVPSMLLGLALIANRSTFRVAPLRDFGWRWHVQPIREGKAFNIPINPPD